MLLLLLLVLVSFKKDEDLSFSGKEATSGADYFMNTGVSLKDKGEIDKALLYLKKASSLYSSSAEYTKEISCLYYLGCLYELKQDDIAAIQCFTEANYQILNHKLSHPLKLDILYKIAKQYFNQNKFDQSYNSIKLCIKESARSQGTDSSLARIYRLKGIAEYYKGDFSQAIESLQKSVNFGSKAFGNFSLFVSDQLNNLGVMNFMINRIDDALAYYQKSESVMTQGRISSPAGLAGTYTNIGLIFRTKDDYDNALLFYNKAVELSLADLSNAKSKISSIYINTAAIYRFKKEFKKEFENLKKAEEFSKYNQAILPKVFQQLAIYYTEIKNYPKAESYYKIAIQKAKQQSADNPEIAYFYVNYGQFLSERNRIDQSFKAYNKALPLIIKLFGQRHASTASCLASLSDLYFKSNDYEKALEYLQKAIVSNCLNFNSLDVRSNPGNDDFFSNQLMVELLTQKALILEDISRISASQTYDKALWNTYLLTLKTIDKIRLGFLNEENRLFLYDNERNTYSKALNCALNLYFKTRKKEYLEEAYIITDKAHASVLQSIIKEKKLYSEYPLSDSSLVLESKIRREISGYQELVLKEKTSSRSDSQKLKLWNEKITGLTFQLEQLQSKLKLTKPAWYRYKFQIDDSRLISHIKNNLKANEAILEYFYTDSLFYAFYLDNQDLKIQKSILPSDFEDNLNHVLAFVKEPKVYNTDSAYNLAYRKSAYDLYKLLLLPFEKECRGKSLIIVPFEKLAYLPFAVLLTNETSNKPYNFKEFPYLIKQHPVRSLFAANLLSNKRVVPVKGKMAAFAPVYPDLKKTGNSSDVTRDKLGSLLETSDEVKNITSFFQGDIFSANKATKENFKLYASHYTALHLAMHAIIDDESPMNSRLAFTFNSNNYSDNMLYTYEIPNIRLNAELVVLSACNTGIGKLRKGEGLMSLTRSFAFAGVPSIVTTLWSVNDKSSAGLMKNFYKHLSSGEEKDIALQEAKLEYLENTDIMHAHPYYWAGYILIGDNVPIHKSTFPSWIYILGGVCFGLLIFLLIRTYRKRKRGTN